MTTAETTVSGLPPDKVTMGVRGGLLGDLQVAWGLVLYDRRAANRTKVLAGLWSVLDPLIQMAAYYFLLVKIFGFREENYIAFLFLSVTLHRFGIASLNRGTSVFIRFRSIIMSGVLPRKTVVVYASVIEIFLDLLLALAVFFPTAALLSLFQDTPVIAFGPAWIALVPLGAILLAYSVGAGLLLSCVTVYWRDLTNVVNMAARVLFFICPVLYPISRIPEEYLGLYMLNPLACFYHNFRTVILDGQWPETQYFLYTIVFVTVLLAVGGLTFRRLEGRVCKYW